MSGQQKTACHGGLVGINYTNITDSYAVASLRGGAICGINQGDIQRCYGNSSCRGVSKVQAGKETDSWTVKKAGELRDKDITAWDFKRIWTISNKKLPVFQSANWYVKASTELPYTEITTAEELKMFADRICQGDKEAAKTNIRLGADISLKQKKTRPIGTSTNPYTGVFDGMGYTISDLNIHAGKDEAAGLFGYITRGKVQNLTVKGTIYGGGDSGLLCGVNDLSEISCCSAIGEVFGYGYSGGLCGNNRGIIRQSNFYGYVRKKKTNNSFKWLIPVGMIILLELGTVTVYAMVSSGDRWNGTYKPVAEERSIKPIINDRTAGQTSENNSITIKVENRATYRGGDKLFLTMSNPAASNQNAVMEILIAKDYLNGEISYAEAETYNKQYEYLTVAKTGAVPPGYLVEEFTWLYNGKTELSPGTYPAFIQVYFYDVKTNEKSLLDSVFEIKLKVDETIEK